VENNWYVYILRCRDDSLYTGITRDVEKRLATHNRGTGAKYTRSRTPVELVYSEVCDSYSDALKREAAIKRMPRSEKLKLIERKSAAE
jgi:putative endonuclease